MADENEQGMIESRLAAAESLEAAPAEQNAATKDCATCDGSGKIKGGSTDCPDCGGTGQVARAEDDPTVERRRLVAEQLDGAMENRRFAVSDLEVRDTSDGGLRFTGYASMTE